MNRMGRSPSWLAPPPAPGGPGVLGFTSATKQPSSDRHAGVDFRDFPERREIPTVCGMAGRVKVSFDGALGGCREPASATPLFKQFV
jgi:hypothetical protein